MVNSMVEVSTGNYGNSEKVLAHQGSFEVVTQNVRCKLEDDIKRMRAHAHVRARTHSHTHTHIRAPTPWSSVLVGEKYNDLCFMCFGWRSGGSVCMLACKLSLPGESVEVQGLCEQMCFNIALGKKGPNTLSWSTPSHTKSFD